MHRESDQKVVMRFLWLLIIGSIVMFAGVNLYAKEVNSNPNLISPKADKKVLSEEAGNSFVESSEPQVSRSLQEAVTSSLTDAKGTYGVYIKNLKTNEVFYLNERRNFDAGSLYKLWVMGAVFKKIESGEVKEDEVLSEDIDTLNKKFGISDDEAEQTEGGITLTVSQALNQMITISHNYAALLLTQRIKLSQVADYLKSNSFSESKVGIEGDLPQTNAYDIAQFYEKLYKGKLGSPESTQKMLGLLKAQTLNKKLPKNLPENTTIAHKTGEIGWFSHDGGIVYSDKGDYIIVVLSESENPAGAEDRIANLSKRVFEYFENK